MKHLTYLLLSVAITLAAIFVYDQVRDDFPEPPPNRSEALSSAVDALEARLSALEAEKSPDLQPKSGDERLESRIKDLERRVAAALDDAERIASGAPPADVEAANPGSVPAGDPTPEDIRTFRKLASAARREERFKKSEARVDATIGKLGIPLSAEQRDRLVLAYLAFEPRRDEIWGEAKARGLAEGRAVNWDLIIAETNGAIEREFAERISSFLSGADAAAISAGLNSRSK